MSLVGGNDLSQNEQHLLDACDKHAQDAKMCFAIMTGVFKADSSWCTAGAGARNNNCGNLRPGSGKSGDTEINWWTSCNSTSGCFRAYSNIKDGIYDNVAVYAQYYEGKTPEYMQTTWAGGSHNWKNIVQQSIAKHYYESV